MLNYAAIQEGKRLTLFELFQSENWNIEIPIIQRDYAQGRPSADEVRRSFVSTLLEHLQTGENIDLDFVYGSLKETEKGIFIPLDGQQRLTTLFLLHWYLAQKEDEKDSFLEIFSRNNKSRFTYETRTSSREFCDVLVYHGLDFDYLINDNISETIEDCSWFYLAWKEDPTIKSMLSMLDEIHNQFKETNNLYPVLLETENPVITFQFLNLDAFKLTDDLYIKMNARGKQLTPFENFKARFEQHIKQLDFDEDVEFYLQFNNVNRQVSGHEYFSFKIDTDWANLFWHYKNDATNVFDEELMNFIRVIVTNTYAVTNPQSSFLKILASKATLSFNLYKNYNCFDAKSIHNLIGSLDLLKNGNLKIKKYLANTDYYDEEAVFLKVISNSISYTERLQFYALYQFLLFHKGDSTGLENWMRIIHNLTENTIYNLLDEFVIAINTIDKLLKQSSEILQYFSALKDRLPGFLDLQVTEERIKACLLLKDEGWSNEITEIEKQGYFKGQISFLLNFSSIEDYFKKNGNCNWSEEENKGFMASFILYKEKAISVFGENGLKVFDDAIFERALFTKGDYTLFSKSNYSFLINYERDISWKRLLRDDNNGKRLFVKQLFDDPAFNIQNIEATLKSIIRASEIDDWRLNFIELPGLIEYLGSQRFFRWNSSTDINLLKKERLSGSHVEYFSYSFYLSYLIKCDEDYTPFKSVRYIEVSGDGLPFARLDGYVYKGSKYAANIAYLANDAKYRIRFLEVTQKEVHDDIKTELNYFIPDENSLILLVDNENDANLLLLALCDSLKKIDS